MTREELRAYYRHLDNVIILRDNITTARGEGHLEGKEEGRAEGRAEGIAEGIRMTARKLKDMGLSDRQIAQATGLSPEDIRNLH